MGAAPPLLLQLRISVNLELPGNVQHAQHVQEAVVVAPPAVRRGLIPEFFHEAFGEVFAADRGADGVHGDERGGAVVYFRFPVV